MQMVGNFLGHLERSYKMNPSQEHINRLSHVAMQMGLAPHQAVALPATVTMAANSLGMTESTVIDEIIRVQEMREYIAQVCREVTCQ